MKVGIITYHASHNIGSMLQTYALQNVLMTKYNAEVEIIDFSNKAQQEMYSIFNTDKSVKGVVKNSIVAVNYKKFKKRHQEFEKFITDNFRLTPNSYSELESLKELDGKYDYVICGSDQIWNVNCKDFDDSYFLPFLSKTKKISYAPSLGGKNILKSDLNLSIYKDYINKFDHLSVREVNGKSWLEELSGRNFEVVADPTLIADKKIWENLTNNTKPDGDYIFFYGVPFSKKTYKIVEEISKKMAMPVIMLDLKSYIFGGNAFRDIKLSGSGGPQEYLDLMRNAKMVITTSFHGTIFATIFGKDFWTVTYKETNHDDDRIKTLLSQLDMSHRQIYLEDYEDYDLTCKVDYSKYDENLSVFKEKSIAFLDNSLVSSNS